MGKRHTKKAQLLEIQTIVASIVTWSILDFADSVKFVSTSGNLVDLDPIVLDRFSDEATSGFFLELHSGTLQGWPDEKSGTWPFVPYSKIVGPFSGLPVFAFVEEESLADVWDLLDLESDEEILGLLKSQYDKHQTKDLVAELLDVPPDELNESRLLTETTNGAKRNGGRPHLQLEAWTIYNQLFPSGHRGKATWPQVEDRTGFSASTIRRARQRYGKTDS